MSPAEKAYLREIDEMILGASPAKLRKIQELDLESQLSGMPFGDVWAGRRMHKLRHR